MSPITFVTVGLTAGAALAAVPVIIHLIMRQTPKHVIFPALRLIKQRQKQSRKRLRIRNWLLLLARMVLIALMALALARPKVSSQTSLGDQEVPNALALVFDTSLSMEYREQDKSRLREGQDRALEILGRSHESSQVFVIDSAEPVAPVAMSPSAARKRVESLTIRPVNRPLNQAMGLAYKAVAAVDLPRHEVFVFTDLARSAWELGPGKTAEGLEYRKKVKEGISTYIIRLSPKVLRDVAIIEAEPIGGVATQGEPIQVKVKLRSIGPATKRRVELRIDGVPRAVKEVAIPANGEVDLPPLVTPKLPPGLHQGEVRLAGEPDPLSFDDVRYFTIDVQPPLKVLIVYERAIDAKFVKSALDPEVLQVGAPRPYHVTTLAAAGLSTQPPEFLKGFAAVFLLNVRAPSEIDWTRLRAYVRQGGGLVIAMGDRVLPSNYNDTIAAQLLPAALTEAPFPKRAKAPFTSFGNGDWSHPLLNRLHEELQQNLATVPVYRYALTTPKPGSRMLLRFQEGDAPALVERAFPAGPRTGRVLLWTTALSRRAEFDPSRSPEAWTDFPYFDYWSFFEIMNRTVPYLAGIEGRSLTFEVGDLVRLPIEADRRFTNYTVRAPGAKTTERLSQSAGTTALTIESPAQVGPWTVVASGPEGASKTLGFSVNPPRDEERITPLDTRDLDALFPGKDAYRLAENTVESLKQAVTIGRIGHELFPWIMLLVLALVTAENYLANKFYRERTAKASSA